MIMKTLSTALFLIFMTLVNFSYAQGVVNYQKLKVPSVDAGGKITDAAGVFLGTIGADGKITDATGTLAAHIDAFNNTVDEKSGENVGKTDGEGNFFLVVNKKLVSWKTSYPETGVQICLVKDLKGNILAAVHKNFKQYGSSAVYYLLPKPKKSQTTKVTTTTTTTETTKTKTTTKKTTKSKKSTKTKPKTKSTKKSKTKTTK